MTDLFQHPLASSDWEQRPAVTHRPSTRAIWAEPTPREGGAPERRIVHARAVHAEEEMTLRRLGLQSTAGYHKCASGAEIDRPLSVTVRVPHPTGWRTLLEHHADERPDEVTWLDLDGLRTTGLVVEVRRVAVDGYWPGWNVAMGGLVLEGEAPATWRPQADRYFQVADVDVSDVPDGMTAEVRSGEVRYRSPFLEVGFRLRTSGFAFLGIDADGNGRTGRNLLQLPRSMDIVRSGVYPSGVYPVLRDQHAEYLAQGPRLSLSTGHRASGFALLEQVGTTEVSGNQVRYRIENPELGHELDLTWTVEARGLSLRVRRTAQRAHRAWTSGVWHVATDNRVTPTTLLGSGIHVGETGLVRPPALWHFPRHGSLRISTDDEVMLRADSVRPLDTNTLELKLGERPTPEGDYEVLAGDHHALVHFAVDTPAVVDTTPDTPPSVRRMLSRHGVTALPYRQDTATYSNNGASMHCTSLLNDLSALSIRFAAPVAGADPTSYLRSSLERWLTGAPGYGSGRTMHGDHLLEDEYVQIAADSMLAMARYLEAVDDGSWLRRFATEIDEIIRRMRDRDVDGDGLVESTIRRGVTGEHQWSTAWADVISFGWKDAWANAVLYEALRTLERAAARLEWTGWDETLGGWADALRVHYTATFLNPETGLIAGWRCAEDRLHDYAFPLVNGAAARTDLLEPDTARSVMETLWREFENVGYDDFRNGIPLALHRIPEEEIGGVVFGLPLGGYQQGGASHHRAALFVDGLFAVGMEREGERVLHSLASTIADDTAFGGLGTGVDWRMWDGTPSGYEGQLAEGFSILATAVDRYGVQ